MEQDFDVKVFIQFLALFFWIVSAKAGMSETLPAGINSPIFKFGYVQGLSQKYNETGQLWRLGDLRSVEFDAPTLARMVPKARILINSLNRFGNQRLGDSLNLGVLEFNIDPKVSYFAPVYARGITDSWTLAFALPVITYTNKIKLSRSFSNIEFYKREFGGLDPELDRALATDLGAETMKTIEQAGYKPLEDKSETYLHDVQLVSLYKFYEREDLALLHAAYLGLPTGPRYDPDDIAALNMSGQTSLENGLTVAYEVFSETTLMSTLSHIYYLPDTIVRRVPRNEDDMLPDNSSKESVKRSIGGKLSLKNEVAQKFHDKYKIGVGHTFGTKAADAYRGGMNSRYDLLETNTSTQEQTVSLSVSYDTVKSYFKKQSAIPMIISYDLSDTIAGRNVERRLIQEVNLILFF